MAGASGPAGPAGREPDPLTPALIRSAERRRWAADLTIPTLAGLVVYGAGGIGKSTLARQIASRVSHLEPGRVTVVISGEVSAGGLLAEVTAALRRHPALALGGSRAESARAACQADLPYAHRLSLLRDQVLVHVPVLLVLDDFDDNVASDSGDWKIRDPALAELIANWASATHRGKLLITCRHPFTQPTAGGPPLGFRHLGPLSRSGAFELAKSLPALGRLGEQELDRAWRLLGGHPHAMKYLDSVLATGEINFREVARRVAHAIGAATGDTARPIRPAAPTELPPQAAETIALAAGDLLVGGLFDQLSRGARELLIRAASGRAAIGRDVLALAAGREGWAEPARLVAECLATGLLAADPSEPASVFVPRWTADQLGRLAEAHRRGEGPGDGPVSGAHRRRARPWRPGQAATVAVAVILVAVVLVAVAAGVSVTWHPGSSTVKASAGAPPRLAAVLDDAAAVRSRAAAWVARQISRNAIVACDPDMCSALLAQGLPAGNLLELRAATPDPLGSDVVVATAAVRSQFGGRLAGVYAPGILATFGSGGLRIDVRAVAPDGTAAYRAALASDLVARREAARQLLGNPRLNVSPAARTELRAGQVDPRLLTTLAALTATGPVQVTAFGDSGPGAGEGMPLRSAEISVLSRTDLARLRHMSAFVHAQRPPYLPARALIAPAAGGSFVLTIEFAAPSPAGLLQPEPAR